MTSKHHKWQAKWQATRHADGSISLAHADGLQMLAIPQSLPQPPGAVLVQGLAAPHGHSLRTYTLPGYQTVAEWVAAQPSIRDATSRATKQARMLREAAAVLAAAATSGSTSSQPTTGHTSQQPNPRPTLRKRA